MVGRGNPTKHRAGLQYWHPALSVIWSSWGNHCIVALDKVKEIRMARDVFSGIMTLRSSRADLRVWVVLGWVWVYSVDGPCRYDRTSNHNDMLLATVYIATFGG